MADHFEGVEILAVSQIQPPFCGGTEVMSATQISFGRMAATVWATRLSATGSPYVEFVVALNQCICAQRNPSFLRSRLIRETPAENPSSHNSA